MSRSLIRLLWIAPFVLLAPVYLTGNALFWGTPLLQFVPWWKTAWDALLAGHLPLWNPLVGMGAPLLANYQSALLYPFTWVYFIFYLLGGVRLMAWGQALLLALHLALAALGTARLVRRLGMGVPAQVIAGLAYGLSGYLVSRAWFLSINAATAWRPWVLFALTSFVDALQPSAAVPAPGAASRRVGPSARRAFVALAGFLALQLLSGHAQTTWYTLVLAGLWALFFGWSASTAQPPAARLRFCGRILAGLALAGMLAGGLAAAQLLPTAEYLAQSQRSSAVAYDYAMNYSFWPWYLLALFAPGIFGSPVSGDFWGYANYWENALYVGVLPLFLALSTLRAALSRKAPPRPAPVAADAAPTAGLLLVSRPAFVRFLWLVIVVAFLFALGSFTPLYPWLYRHVPTFSLFQAPARWLLWVEIALALLAAIGVDAWRRPRHAGLYWTRLSAAGAFAVALGAGLGWLLLGEVSPSFVRAIALFGFWGLGVALLSLYAPPAAESDDAGSDNLPGQPGPIARGLGRFFPARGRPRPPNAPRSREGLRATRPYSPGAWQLAVGLWLALDLLAAGWGLNPGGSLALYDPSPAAEQARLQAQGGRVFIPAALEQWLKYTRFLRFDTFDPGESWRNFRGLHLPAANLLDNLATANQFDPLTPAHYAGWLEMLAEAPPAVYPQLIDLMNVGLVETLARHAPNGVRFTSLSPGGRVRFAPCAVWVPSEQAARALMLSGAPDFARQVGLLGHGEPAPCPPAASTSAGFTVAALDESSPNRLGFTVTTTVPGWVWVADVDYPGWGAQVDGQEADILCANYAFRAVYVAAPGEHQILFVYRPVSFYAGVLISLASLLIFLVLVVKKAVDGVEIQR